MTTPRDVTAPLESIIERWKSVARQTPIVRKDLPGASAEWCFAPRKEDEKILLGLIEEWDRLEDAILPELAGILPLKQAEFREIMRIIRHKLDLNGRNRHFVGYSGKNDPDGETGRAHFLAAMERTAQHFMKLSRSIDTFRPPGGTGKTSP